jgi:glycosyltransferase involved in cell wall biosynthesis
LVARYDFLDVVEMKIALIGTTAACVLGFRADLIRTLVEKGHQVYAFALDFDDTTRARVRAFGAEPVDYVFSRAGLNPLSDISNTYKLGKLLKQISPDIVFSYFSKPVIFGTLAAVLAGVQRRIGMLEGLGYVFTERPEGVSFKGKILKLVQVFLYRVSFPFLERLIFLNKDDPSDLVEEHRLKVSKISVLGGIGLTLSNYPYSVPPKNPVSFIFVGRLLADKGINEFIQAARIVKQQSESSRFVILGGLDESNPGGLTSSQVSTLIDEGLVEHHGHVEDVTGFLTNSSVFVLPSYREGVPRSTQEAMAIGRPVITTDVPGCRETVIEGLNGFIVPPWSAELLAERMLFFVENPDQIETMGLQSFKIAQENFDAQLVNERLISYFL